MGNKQISEDVETNDRIIQEKIDRLYGIKDYKEEYHPEITAEEKKKIKKQMVFLIWFCLIMGVLIILNLVNPITKLFDKETPTVENEKTLQDLPSGTVNIENQEIKTMLNTFKFDVNNPLYEANIVKLFNESKRFEQMDFELKMFLLTSNDKFNEYMRKNTNLKSYNIDSSQNLSITISTKVLDNIAKEVFGREAEIDYQSFKYYYLAIDKVQYFDAILEGDVYTFVPIEAIPKAQTQVYLKPVTATNIDNEIYIRSNVLFVRDGLIYNNIEMKNSLGTDINKLDDYYTFGSAIEFFFRRLVDEENNIITYRFERVLNMKLT